MAYLANGMQLHDCAKIGAEFHSCLIAIICPSKDLTNSVHSAKGGLTQSQTLRKVGGTFLTWAIVCCFLSIGEQGGAACFGSDLISHLRGMKGKRSINWDQFIRGSHS